MREALANTYRPTTFEDVIGQTAVIKTLNRQLATQTFKNCYLFAGPSGCGKTTLARIFANKINNGLGEPIEIDGASNNGVDNVRDIIEKASKRSLDSEYKIYIIDECHMLTINGWNAFLKCIEEPPKYTIFIFCTTNPEKIPATIQNRVQRFTLNKIKTQDINDRLVSICEKEGATNYTEACFYIANISQGGMRDAIANLDKCLSYSNDLSIDNVISALGGFKYETFFELTGKILDKDMTILNMIDSMFDNGVDLKLFIDQYLVFVLDCTKYCLTKDIRTTNIPGSMKKELNDLTGVDFGDHSKFFAQFVEKILEIKTAIRYDSNVKSTISAMLLQLCRE